MLALIASPRFVDHTPPPGHPERPERAEVFDVVADAWRARGGAVLEPRAATRAELARVHTGAHIDRMLATRGHAVMIDADTFTSPETVDLAMLAAGAGLTGLEWVLASESPRRALALVRPPGHHAEADAAMGFCLFNNIAVAAAAALDAGLARVAIVDVDVHHGNGTEHSFASDPRVLFISTHQAPLYPGTGAAGDIGQAAAAGLTVNIPLDAGATDADYLRVFDRLVVPIVDEFAPGIVLVSAGFDAHARDPLAQMRVTSAGFAAIARRLVALADRRAHGRLVAITEGGYDLSALRESLTMVIDEWSAAPGAAGAAQAPAPDADAPRADRAIAAVRAAQAGRWRGL